MSDEIEFDYVILRCNGCKARQKLYPDLVIKGSKQLIEWMNTNSKKFCQCSSETCDILCHIKGAPEIPEPK